jgi:membrane protein CcdC involved in cytochrome C biogenesis
MIKLLLKIVIGIVIVILLAGMYKFNILQDDIYIENEKGEVVPLKYKE